ncbi:glycosyltransferase family 4 protein [Bacteroides congonensis]
MKILIVAFNYPSKYCSADFVFVKMLVDEFARQGHECVVMAPHSVTHHKCLHYGMEEYSVGNNTVKVVRPNYFSTSSLIIGKYYISNVLHKMIVRCALHYLKFEPDVVYCHFWKQGIEAFPFAKKHKLPLFVASGECEIFEDNRKGELKDFCNYVKGVICVSTKNKDESIGLELARPENCIVVPNSIDSSLFKKLDKQECRCKLGLPLDKTIIAFVGWFVDRKGSMRISQALDSIPEKDVYSLFIGSGPEEPTCDNILFKGKVAHNDVPKYLNAADAFVLPTLQEGCCNAVVEAMACGLPVISSNLSFNWDVLNKNNSIMIDPMNVEEIKQAIIKIRDNAQMCESMSNAALEMAKQLTIQERAKKILSFMQQRM